jgi:ATP-binding protein involved in chromosome partitioning
MSQILPGVKASIAVVGGKGGVGNSTVAANLAIAFSQTGAKVGLLDGNIYSPGVPGMFGLDARMGFGGGGSITPPVQHGIQLMSMGLFSAGNAAIMWRGPMAQNVFQQLLQNVQWDDVDFLFVDLPSGTEGIELQLTQSASLIGALLVTIPKQTGLVDVRRELQKLVLTRVSILGLVENMSYYVCPACHHRSEIFGAAEGEKEARMLGIPFLGRIPIDSAGEERDDEGQPLMIGSPDSPAAQALVDTAANLLDVLGTLPAGELGSRRSEVKWMG